MTTFLNQVKKYRKQGYSLENISRFLNIPYDELIALSVTNPQFFPPQKPNVRIKGHMPLEVPGTNGVPRALLLAGQCCFPLSGEELPTQLSLMCGEPVEVGNCYCAYHAEMVAPRPGDAQ